MYREYFMIFYIILYTTQGYHILQRKNSKKEYLLENIQEEFKFDDSLLIFNNFNASINTDIIKYMNIKTILDLDQNAQLKKHIGDFDAYVFVIGNISDLQYTIQQMRKLNICNFNAKYLVLFQTDNPKEIFEITWSHHLLNVDLLIENEDEFTIFTHFPYANGSCGTNIIPQKIEPPILYPEKISPNMNGCELKIMSMGIVPYVVNISAPKSIPAQAGFELTIINTILRKMNFSDVYIKNPNNDWGYVLSDGNFTKMLKSLYDRDADILLGMFIANDTVEEYFDGTISHIELGISWIVPTARQIAQWKNITVIFHEIVWISIFLVFLLNGITWWILGKNSEQDFNYDELSICMMGAFCVLLQGSLTSPKTWKLRIVVYIWFLFSLLISTAYECQLTGILTSPLYEHQISNKKDLVTSNLGFGYHMTLKDVFADPNNAAHRKIYHNQVVCDLSPACINRTAFKRDIAMLKNKRQVNYLTPRWYMLNGKPLLYGFKEAEVIFRCKFFVNKGFPFLEKINDYIRQLQSSGLILKWETDIAPDTKRGLDTPQLEALKLSHLQSAFYLLLLGLSAASILLVIEIVYDKFMTKCKQQNYNRKKF